jgi:hypothetical protein
MASLADKFVLARLVNMRGVNLRVFEFDYDCTWFGFFLDADEHIYGRFGGRDSASPDTFLTEAGLQSAMTKALTLHNEKIKVKVEAQPNDSRPVRRNRPEEYPSSQRLKPGSCIHCHHVYDFFRDELRAAGTWKKDRDTWKILPPDPTKLGLVLDSKDQSRIAKVSAGSPAERAGLHVGDQLHRVNGQTVGSFADLQHALRSLPERGEVEIVLARPNEKPRSLRLPLPEDWRKSEISWRPFMWGIEPTPNVWGHDLTAEEKKKAGLDAKQLAFRQGSFVPPAAREAGIQAGDIILGLDEKKWEMSAREFQTHVRFHYNVGDRVTIHYLRDCQRRTATVILRQRPY